MRGEDQEMRLAGIFVRGSPPHARGRLSPSKWRGHIEGITPACAGKTNILSILISYCPDHPRMRGEDDVDVSYYNAEAGSPPHARGRLNSTVCQGGPMGITPACAGKTCSPTDCRPPRTDHPRMRGEDSSKLITNYEEAGSPPHARGRPETHLDMLRRDGITPACAGKTQSSPPERGR